MRASASKVNEYNEWTVLRSSKRFLDCGIKGPLSSRAPAAPDLSCCACKPLVSKANAHARRARLSHRPVEPSFPEEYRTGRQSAQNGHKMGPHWLSAKVKLVPRRFRMYQVPTPHNPGIRSALMRLGMETVDQSLHFLMYCRGELSTNGRKRISDDTRRFSWDGCCSRGRKRDSDVADDPHAQPPISDANAKLSALVFLLTKTSTSPALKLCCYRIASAITRPK